MPYAGLYELKGALHIHSKYPQNPNSIDDIVSSARKAGLDFILITDHDTLKTLEDGKEGFYGDVLVLIGEEVTTPVGHLLVWGIEKPIVSRSPREIINEVKKQNGLVCVAHPFAREYSWKDWDVTGFNGIELYNTQANIIKENPIWLGIKSIIHSPDDFFRSTAKVSPEAIQKWDELLKERKTIAIGSTDAHERHGLPGFEFDSYDIMLRTVSCHVNVPSFDKKSIIEAFRKGCFYISFDLFGFPEGFLFYLKRGEKEFPVGSILKLMKGDKIIVEVNKRSHIRLISNGKVIRKLDGVRLDYTPQYKGYYRVEVYKDKKPWIFSNPLYLE